MKASNTLPATITFKVTSTHIEKGEKSSCNSCPVALAINEEIAPSYVSIVHPSQVYIKDLVATEIAAWASVPAYLAEWINEYDAEKGIPTEIEASITLQFPS